MSLQAGSCGTFSLSFENIVGLSSSMFNARLIWPSNSSSEQAGATMCAVIMQDNSLSNGTYRIS